MKNSNSKHGAFILEAEQAHIGYCVIQYEPLQKLVAKNF